MGGMYSRQVHTSTDIGGVISALPKSLRDVTYKHDAFRYSQMVASWSTLLLVGITVCPVALELVTNSSLTEYILYPSKWDEDRFCYDWK